jgi:hypothetical protein
MFWREAERDPDAVDLAWRSFSNGIVAAPALSSPALPSIVTPNVRRVLALF